MPDERVFLLADEIVRRESGWKHDICNRTTSDGCAAGQGLFQVVYGTERTCEGHFGREMDMLDAYDNIDCGVWLLTANGVRQGIGHWDSFGRLYNGRAWGSGPYDLSLYAL